MIEERLLRKILKEEVTEIVRTEVREVFRTEIHAEVRDIVRTETQEIVQGEIKKAFNEHFEPFKEFCIKEFEKLNGCFDALNGKFDDFKEFTVSHIEKLHDGQEELIEKVDRLSLTVELMKTGFDESRLNIRKINKRVEKLERTQKYA